MNQLNRGKFPVFLIIIFACTNCSTNHHQQEFRQQALSLPSGIQATQANGTHKTRSQSDPTDWRIGPRFSGLVEVITPAYPNPVSYNTPIKILINVTGYNAIDGLKIYAFRELGNFQIASPIRRIPKKFQPGLHTIKISPSQFVPSSSSGNFGNLYRIIFMSGQNRIITYGDVKVK